MVANMIGQRHMYSIGGKPPVRPEAIRECLRHVRVTAECHKASVHMPRIGCGLAGGTWDVIGKIVQEELCDKGIEVTVYDLPTD